MQTATPSHWRLALTGLALAIFGVVALSGPGRIDIEDGQARFEAGRNLIDHGDTALRDERLFWNVFPGRDGKQWTDYRLPQIVVAAGCVAIADATGAKCEARRHFAFAWHGALCASLMAILYACFFRKTGLTDRQALIWAALGILATPNWYYATSTFDDILTALVGLALILCIQKSNTSIMHLLIAALFTAILYHCKPPMVALALVGLGLKYPTRIPKRNAAATVVILGIGLILGWASMKWYHLYKFPAEYQAEFDRIVRDLHPALFFGNIPEALIDMAVGPSSGVFWYFPPLVLVITGVMRPACNIKYAYLLCSIAIVGFVSLLVFYKGGVCWGPRYLTPLFAAGWLFAPGGAARLSPFLVKALLAFGLLVQVLALTAVPERLYVQRDLPTGFYVEKPWWYLHPAIGHIVNRPRELLEVLDAPPSPLLTPSPAPTFTLPIFNRPFFNEPRGQVAIEKYQLLNGPRFWWHWMQHQPPGERAVDIAPTVLLLMAFMALGIVSAARATRPALAT